MKRIFLTGASSGIGLAIAQALSASGHDVWGTSRRIERIPRLPGMHPLTLDLADRDSLGQIFRNALHEAGQFDVVINNAGSGYFGPAEALSREHLAAHLQVLFLGQVELLHCALESMRTQEEGGLIISVSSLASRLPVPFMAAYNASKAALASYIMSLQLELPDRKVRLVDLQPADIRTSFNDAVVRARTAEPRVTKTWEAVDHNMKTAPPPDLVASHVLRLIEHSRSPARITVGGFFQATVAPLIFRFLPQSIRLWGLRKYYGI